MARARNASPSPILGGKVTGLAGRLVALAAGAGMVALAKSSMAIDATAKLSDWLGITTEPDKKIRRRSS